MMDSAQSTISNLQSTLPKDWRWVKLGEVCELIMGQSPPSSTYTSECEGLPFFQGKADFGDFYPTVRAWCTHPIKMAEEKDVLISVRAPVGPVNMSNIKCCIGRGLAAIRCKDGMNSWFIFWYLRLLENQIASLGSGSTFGAISRDDLINFQVPLPPEENQHRIATKLQPLMQEIERAKASCEKQLDAANALPPAYLREVFESPEAKKWERKRLGDVLEVIESGSRPKGGVNEIREGIPSVGAEHLNSFFGFNFANIRYIPKEFYQSMKRGKIVKSDVLVVKDGATTGKVSFVNNNFPFEESAVNEHVFILRAKEFLDQEFLFWFLYSSLGQTQIQQEFHGAAQGGINQQFVSGVYISIPSLDIQKRIIAKLKEKIVETEKLRTTIEKQLETINAIPQAILRKAFRGELIS